MTPWVNNKQSATYPGLGQEWKAMRHEKLRIAFYSHDTMGIGHMRRNGLIAQTFAASQLRPNILMICGAREAGYFDPPNGVDYLTLPALAKRQDGVYQSRRLDVDLEQLIRLRSEILRAALHSFDPDVLIVDKVPRGALRELDPALHELRDKGNARCVLGLRDVLDDPCIVAQEWLHDHGEAAIREFYDAVWVYGSAQVYDVARRYCWSSDVAEKIHYTGYLRRFCDDASSRNDVPVPHLPDGPIMLCMVGGGQDGGHVAEAFAHAEFPRRTSGVIVTGPFMPADAARRLRDIALRREDDLHIIEFSADIDLLIRRAQRVVAMGGYNTVCELLSLRKASLIIPRTIPRREQLIRAENMHALGLLDYLRPERLTPDAITQWLSRDLPRPLDAFERIDFDGLSRLPALLSELLATRPSIDLSGAIEHVA